MVPSRMEAAGQRGFRPDDGEIDAVHVGGVGEPVEIVRRDGKVRREGGGAGIPRGCVDVGVRVLPAQRPAKCMFPAAPSDDEQPHFFWAPLNASAAALAARFAAPATSRAISFASPV